MAREKKNKTKKPFLKIGLILLAVALLIGGGYIVTGSIVFARNAIALALIGGAGIGVGNFFGKKIGQAIANKRANKSRNRTRTRDRNRDRENEREHTEDMSPLPGHEEENIATPISARPIDNPSRNSGRGNR